MSCPRIQIPLALLCVSLYHFSPHILYAQSAVDPKGDTRTDAPPWTDLTRISVDQDAKFVSLTLETADSIPKHISESCQFQILLQTNAQVSPSLRTDQRALDLLIASDLSHWDGSPWFATQIYSKFDKNGIPADTGRLFDWKLSGNSLRVRFSLEGLGWSSLAVKARVFYGTDFSDVAPDSGWVSLLIDRTELRAMKTRSSSRAVFTYPEGFDSVLTRFDVLQVVDAAYRYESELTVIPPIGGDTIRFIFNPFYGGAAIEGDPIYLGPGMWGETPLWFVYFHELGHNFINASARFRQLYPLEMRLPPGPLPTHILFYEAWASLPAMYVFDMIDQKGTLDNVSSVALENLRKEWSSTRQRFIGAWIRYKENPTFTSLNPDIVDGMFLELQERFGWRLFHRFFALMRPAGATLDLFDARLEGDSEDLRITRTTLTAAALSAAAGSDLQAQFKQWGVPIDDILFARAFKKLRQSID